jgi:putative tryptophan/tyrosine transport system substrate-binding protein
LRRRDFIRAIGGAAAAWPLAARAQQRERMRRIGALMGALPADDPESQVRSARFLQGLQELGWTVGRNVQIDWRWSALDRERYRAMAAELVAVRPDVLLTNGPTTPAMRQATRTIPIVFVGANDPVGAGLVSSLAHPGGNLTGFAAGEYGFSAKWLQLLKQIAPNVTRAAVMRDPGSPGGTGQLGALQGAAFILGMELTLVDPADPGAIENAITEFARRPNGGLVVPRSAVSLSNRQRILALAAQHRLPAVYDQRRFVADGGLISYGIDNADLYWRAAAYVDRILKGEKPADLPVQAPVKYETVINLKTAKALGLDVPPTLRALATEVIE